MLELEVASNATAWQRWFVAAGIICLVGAGRRYRQWTDRAGDYMLERSELIVFAGGLAWWYWLRPSFLGVAVAAGALLCFGLRTAMRRRRADERIAL